MKNFKKTLLNGVKLFALLGLVLVVAGCEPIVETVTEYDVIVLKPVPASLQGTWTGGTAQYPEKYTITSSEFSSGDDGYKGAIEAVRTASNNGIIYIKYTKAIMPDWSFSESAPDVGKYYAIHYKNLTDTSVELSAAYKEGGKSSTNTLEEAVLEFTVDNGYFGWYSSVDK